MLIYFLILISCVFSQESSNTVFPVGEVGRERIDFWIKIYTEIQTNEGILHDPVRLDVVYTKFSLEGLSQRQSSRFIDDKRDMLRDQILRYARENVLPDEPQLASILPKFNPDELEEMARRIRWQRGQADRFAEGLMRSYLYIDHIKQIFKEEGVPIELSYLPHVESSFQYQAYSKVGAAGIWQFMRATARLFRLRMDYMIDERLDPLKAARAAARLLRVNYERLASWPLAITAYNHGAAGIERAVNAVGSSRMQDLINSYQGRRFGFASQNFYSCFAAAYEVSQNPEKYFGNFKKQSPIEFFSFKLPKSIRVKTLVSQFEIDIEEFKSFNRAFRPNVFQANAVLSSGTNIHLPLRLKGSGAKVEAQIAVQKEEIIDLQTGGDHIIAQGESLHQIANLYRVTLSDLIRLNNIEDPSRIMPGTKLAIPGKSSLNGSVSTASNVKVVAIQNKIAKNNANPVSTVVSVVEAPAVVPVQQDPVAASIRERWPKSELLNPFDLVATHKVMPNFVEPNQDHLSLVTNDITKSYDFSVKILGQGIARITVEIDETPGHLAEWAGVGLTAIRRLNGLGLKNSINVGEKLDLPLNEKSLVAFNTKRLEYHLSLEEDFFANYRVTGVRTHIVKRGDILTALLMREQIPVWLYRKYQKDTTSEKIFVGQELSIPLVESISTQTNFMEQNFNPSDIGEDENRATP